MSSDWLEHNDFAPDQPLPLLNRSDQTPAAIEAQVMQVNVRSSLDDLTAALDAGDWLLARARSIDGVIKQIAINWIARNGPFAIGEIQHSVGYSTTTKCTNVSQTAHTLLEAVGGDIDQFIGTLISQPFKPATARSFIDQKRYATLFKTSRSGRLVQGVPERILKRADRSFVNHPVQEG